MIRRNITRYLENALKDTPVVLLNGARQTGKSTLSKEIISKIKNSEYYTMDNSIILNAAINDPPAFIEGLSGTVVLDEIQKAPQLFTSIKYDVDSNKKMGKYILTGSANILLLPSISESLAGRMEILTLFPFSQGEIEGVKEGFIDFLFQEKTNLKKYEAIEKKDLLKRIITGGFPEILIRKDEERRAAWFGSYITTILQKDIRDIANIEGLTEMPKLLSLLASRSLFQLNITELSRSAGIPTTTLKRYLILLQATFLIDYLKPWSGNLGKRLTKTPKIFFTDTGLMSFLLGTGNSLSNENPFLGILIENFVLMELKKQITWSKIKPEIFYFRTHEGEEVDLVLQNSDGKVVGIEIKSSTTVNKSDLKGLNVLSQSLGEKFVRGIVLYTGNIHLNFSKNISAIPISYLWKINAVKN